MSASTSSQLPVSNVESERALLGALLINNRILDSISFLDQSHFYLPAHRDIFTTCSEMVRDNRLADPCTVQSRLPAELDGVGPTADYLDYLTRDACISVSAVSYAEMIRDLAQRRRGQRDNVVEFPQGDGNRRRGALIKSSREFVAGFVPPDYLVDGLVQEAYLYSLTGATGAGKTAITLRLAASVASGASFASRETKKRRVLYLAAENPVDVRMRWIALAQQMDVEPIRLKSFLLKGLSKSRRWRRR